MFALIFVGDRHEISEEERTSRGLKTRLQDIRARDVFAADFECTGRADLPMSSLVFIQKRGENGGAVKPWPAQPIERTSPRNEGC